MVRSWQLISSKPLGDFRIFTLRSDLKVNPRTGREHEFFILDCVDWVNVVALTPHRELVMVEQYRHGSSSVELEIPGGIMDGADASPIATGIRELREETGYEGTNAALLGQVYANPAILTNTCYTILVENCQLQHEPQLDGGEDLVTRLVQIDQVPALIAQGRIRHSLVVSALYCFELQRRGQTIR